MIPRDTKRGVEAEAVSVLGPRRRESHPDVANPLMSPTTGEVPRTASSPNEPSVFSSREFVETCARSFGKRYRPFEIGVRGSGPDRSFWALENGEPLGLRSFSLAPCGLHASPGWEGDLSKATLAGVIDQMKGARTRKLGWKVLFEQRELADGLESLGLKSTIESTHVVHLNGGYERVFAGYSASIRNQVRKARSRGVTVRQARWIEIIQIIVAAKHRRSMCRK